LIIPLVAFSCT